MPIDARAAKLLQPGQHIILPEHPGLRLTASETRRTWIYRYKSPVDGGMRQIKIGEWPALDYIKAAAEWQRLRIERDGGADPQLQKKAARRAEEERAQADATPAFTVAQLIDDYLCGHIDLHRKPKGRGEVRRFLTKNTMEIAGRPADHLLRSEAHGLLQGLADRPVLMGMVRQEMAAAYDFALDAGKLPESTPNWWRMVFRGKMPRSKGKLLQGVHMGTAKRVLSEKEVGVLLNWLPNLSRMLQDVLTMYLWTGCRGAEIMAAQVQEIVEEKDGWWWVIPKHKTKNHRRENAADQRVPLIGRARAIVLRRRLIALDDPESMGYLYPSKGLSPYVEQKVIQSSLYPYQPYSQTKNARWQHLPTLPVTHWSPHDLRRTVRTMLAIMGCPSEVAESVLGHMLPGIVGIYNRYSYDAERLEWLTRLDVKLEQLAVEYAAS